jgi:hypothetical protein
MTVRAWCLSDRCRLSRLLRRQPFDYERPRLRSLLGGLVYVDEQDQPVMAVTARPTVEIFMLADPDWGTPAMRFEALKALHEAVRLELVRLGYEDGHLWLPPAIEKAFARRLMRSFGWMKNLWGCYFRKTSV